MLLLVIAQTSLTLALGPRGQLGALLAVVVERYAVATRVCERRKHYRFAVRINETDLARLEEDDSELTRLRDRIGK